MRNTILLAFYVVALMAAGVWAQQPDGPADLAGDWSGAVVTPVGEITVLLTMAEDGGAVIESVDQAPGQKNPVSGLAAADGALSFSVPSWNATYTGQWDPAADAWTGVFAQGLEFPLTLRRGAPQGVTVEGLDGRWQAALARGGASLRLILRVATTERGTVARLDSPDMGAADLAVGELRREGASVRFTVPAGQVVFDGALADDGTLSGTWTRQGQAPAQVTFSRADDSADRAPPRRPQMPQPPLPYEAEEVRFANAAAGIELAGTLTLPAGPGPFPAAVLIVGSGTTDRDESLAGHKPFLVLADHLARQGIATLRYDKRGVGESGGRFMGATWADFATDAAAAAAFLRARPEIARDAVGFVGHSEGGAVGPIAAAADPDIAFLAVLAGPGTDFRTLILAQDRLTMLAQGATEEEIGRIQAVTSGALDAAIAAPDAEAARAAVRDYLTPDLLVRLGASEAQKDLVAQQIAGDWMLYALRYDPAAVFARIEAPVLLMSGLLDRQAPAEANLAALQAAASANPDVTVLRFPGLNHMFQTARTGTFGEYADIEETFAPAALNAISDWINARVAAR